MDKVIMLFLLLISPVVIVDNCHASEASSTNSDSEINDNDYHNSYGSMRNSSIPSKEEIDKYLSERKKLNEKFMNFFRGRETAIADGNSEGQKNEE